ncbi:MAG: hypothetical protein ABSB58_08305, partial [Gemmatimonadales bacterium]
ATLFTADVSERYLPGTRYPPECAAKVLEDREGFTLYTPLILATYSGNVYVRDLHAGDTLALAMYPGRPIYLVRPAGPAERSTPRFYPVSRDSLAQAWGVPVSRLGAAPSPLQ